MVLGRVRGIRAANRAGLDVECHRDPGQEADQYVHFAGPERAEHARPNRLADFPEVPKGALSFRRECDGPGAGVGRVPLPRHQPAALEEHEHRAHGAGVGRHAPGQFALGEGAPATEGREEDELVGGDAVRRERGLRPAVEGQIRGAERERECTSIGHSEWPRDSCVYARSGPNCLVPTDRVQVRKR